MLQLNHHSRIFIAIQPVDFRKQIDGLVQCCRQPLNQDPFSGAVFVFRNRARTAIRVLTYDGQGFWLCMKRLSQGKLKWWPTSEEAARRLHYRELQLLLWNGNPEQSSWAEDWRKVA